MGKPKLKMPKKGPTAEKVELFEYRVAVRGQEYAIQTANPLDLESLASKKGSTAEITGKELVGALKSYNVNVLMPGIENFGKIYKVSKRDWEGKTVEEKEPVFGGIKKMMELLTNWESVSGVTIEFRGKEKVAKSDLISFNEEANPFTGKTKTA
ncbi:hypothetical protein GF412_04030 [Candidatus Micrarchaeota archaeon]|nr:hypothetical protein [Candidatus Micrarchaeota archaeon]MBD3418118.1 hypothetical protein [Candidatus Micrarchaeota archaeon]